MHRSSFYFASSVILLGLCVSYAWRGAQVLRRASLSMLTSRPVKDSSTEWTLGSIAFSLLPLAPGDRRKTLFEEVVKGKIFTADQIQGVVNVNVPVRSVIVRLAKGGLLVYNPVAPTKEVRDYIKSLETKYGAVKHIVLGSLGLEHKALAGPFSKYYPNSTVWLQPGQWSFPVDLPPWVFGFPFGSDKLRVLPTDLQQQQQQEAGRSRDRGGTNPFSDDFDMQVLGPLQFKSVGGFGEVALFHRSTGTLLVTDTVIRVGDSPPPIITDDPRALLYHCRDSMLERVVDSKENRERGWRRMTLFGLCFYPSQIRVESLFNTIKNVPQVTPEMAELGAGAIPASGALYPWSWVESELPNFRALQGKGGRRGSSNTGKGRGGTALLVAPILQKLILNREPHRVLSWVDRVSAWPIQRIIPAHFENNVRADASSFRAAFRFLETGQCAYDGDFGGTGGGTGGGGGGWLSAVLGGGSSKSTSRSSAGAKVNVAGATAADLGLLNTLSDVFTKLKIIAPSVV